ncbi:MAG: VOC family protein [Chloroflexota bacterium]
MELAELSMPHQMRSPQVKIRKPPLLILLHGTGSSEKEFFSIAQLFDERFIVLTVRAPFLQSTRRYLWFGMESISNVMVMNAIQAEFSRQALLKFIPQAVDAYQADANQVYLLGFDQGAVMALGLALTEPYLVNAVVSISGQLPDEFRTLMARPKLLHQMPLLVIHGLHDEIYPIALGRVINQTLTNYPVQLDYREQPYGHYLTQDSLQDAANWLCERLDVSGISGAVEPPSYRVKLGHVQLKVRNLERSIRFYIRYLGMRLVERTGNAYAFLASDDSHHELALQNLGAGGHLPEAESTGLAVLGFQVADAVALAQVYKHLIHANVPVKAVDHMVRWALYFKDPDGHEVEVYLDIRHLPGKADYWQGRDTQLPPEKILAALKPE